ncbi:hypothetical protein N9L01_00165 [bacterium]|jgi:hypothetical protein|nr:hypothetical protein [bacterium]|tara:strand:+ start:795 stop:1298 length:504 start_codon:yes stop_codon:yes gene_type:complete
MALNPQPYLSDSTDEYLIDALPGIAGNIDANDVVILTFGSSDLENTDSAERLLGFLQMWMVLPQVIDDYYIPMIQDTIRYLEEDSETDPVDLDSAKDQLQGFLALKSMKPSPPMFAIGASLTDIALDELPGVREVYGEWFADQRLDALEELSAFFVANQPPLALASD